ncbi:MAG: class I SAM-dependent methyltransferase, partial [Verrucomicrobiota bacterium]
MNLTIEPPSADLTYWEQIGTTKWGSYTTGIEARAIDRAHSLLPKPTTALEIGCEGGRWSKRLADRGWNMICTDVNRDTLSVCQERIPDARCIHVDEDRRDLPAADNEVDLVLCIEVPPVIHAGWFPGELDRVLRDDGYLVGVFFNNCSARGGLAHRKAERNSSFDFYKLPYAPWRQQLRERGYNIIH